VVTLLSQMFSEKDSDLASQYPTLWNCFLGRFNDIAPEASAVALVFTVLQSKVAHLIEH